MNLTPLLKSLSETKGSPFIFNPAFCHIRDNLYFLAWRGFVRYAGFSTQGREYDNDPLNSFQGPWLGGLYSKMFWNVSNTGGDDYTDIILVRMTNTSFEPLNLEFIGYWRGFSGLVDSRITKISANQYVLTSNAMWYDPKIMISEGQNCGNGCQGMGLILITVDEKDQITNAANKPLCPKIAKHTEKNWAMWSSAGGESLYFSYGLTPTHKVYTITGENNNGIDCEPYVEGYSRTLAALEAFYNSDISCEICGTLHCNLTYRQANTPFVSLDDFVISKRSDCLKCGAKITRNIDKFHISCSTPCIVLENGYYLGIGHVKYFHNSTYRLGSPLQNWLDYIKTINGPEHLRFHYLMFAYRFDKFGNIDAVSDIFTINNSKLVFPVGLEHAPLRNFYITYGDCDSAAMLLQIDEFNLKPNRLPQFINFMSFNSSTINE